MLPSRAPDAPPPFDCGNEWHGELKVVCAVFTVFENVYYNLTKVMSRQTTQVEHVLDVRVRT